MANPRNIKADTAYNQSMHDFFTSIEAKYADALKERKKKDFEVFSART
jgi:hypothetical protein